MTTEPEASSPVVRRHYVFGLRDEVPAPKDGWSVFRHGPDCSGEDAGPRCDGDHCQAAEVCRLFLFDGQDPRFFDGLADLASVLDLTTGRHGDVPSFGSVPTRRAVAMVGAPFGKGNDMPMHYERCMSLLRDTVKALRIATGAHTPNVTIERVWPVYAIVDERADGTKVPVQFVLVEHGWRTVPTATAEQREAAERILIASWLRNPAEVYLDFKLDAQRAVETDGDYVECVLKAAAAAEVLIKHTAWMLTWEATRVLARDPAPGTALVTPNSEAKPRDLIGRVLSPRLKGNWSSQQSQLPIGAWRTAIAKRRNAIIHLGYRPNAAEASEAVKALTLLEKHVLDRLAAQASAYPRAALFSVGKSGLESRGAFDKVRATYRNQDMQNLLKEYLSWLDGHLDLDPQD